MEIQIQVNNQPARAVLALPPGGKGPGVLVLHAWWGLNPFFVELCERLAAQGFVALAPDLNNGEVAQTIAEAEALMKNRDFQRTGEIVMAAKDYLLAQPACTSQQIGVIGFSMGASWALIAAAHAPEQIGATALFYGVGEAEFEKIKAKVICHYSDVDEWEPLENIRWMEAQFQPAGVDATMYLYSGEPHWFMEEDRPEYSPQAAGLAWERTVEFLKENIGKDGSGKG